VGGGNIWTSTNSGVTWSLQTNAGSINWYSICFNSDGTKLAACVANGYIYTSYDTFDKWTEQTGAGSRNWQSICFNSDGTKLVAGVNGGYIYNANSWLLCFNKGTQILSVDNQYIPIENLKKGDLVKIYKSDGSLIYKKVELVGGNTMINNTENYTKCMYRMAKTDENGLIDDLVITGYHSVLVDDCERLIKQKCELDFFYQIEDKYLLYSFNCKDFVLEENNNTYTYYHLALESDDDSEKFGIYANGLLVETTSKKDFQHAALHINKINYDPNVE
jgi:hypothetical protein